MLSTPLFVQANDVSHGVGIQKISGFLPPFKNALWDLFIYFGQALAPRERIRPAPPTLEVQSLNHSGKFPPPTF